MPVGATVETADRDVAVAQSSSRSKWWESTWYSGYASVTGDGRYQIFCTTLTFTGSQFVLGPIVAATSP